jgi:hypothetical protein
LISIIIGFSFKKEWPNKTLFVRYSPIHLY